MYHFNKYGCHDNTYVMPLLNDVTSLRGFVRADAGQQHEHDTALKVHDIVVTGRCGENLWCCALIVIKSAANCGSTVAPIVTL